MPKYLEITKAREEEIGKIVQILNDKTNDFNTPRLVLIGGYALRAYVPFSRATRDCDFVVQSEMNEWRIKQIELWLKKHLETEALETKETFGFMRMIKLLKHLDKIKISLDFMEKEVRGRQEDDIIHLDTKFFDNSKKTDIPVGEIAFKMFVPQYVDYLILKIISARPSDIRDIAALLWKNKIPKNLKTRLKELVNNNELVKRKLKIIKEEISHDKFVDSWRGTFASTQYTQKENKQVLEQLEKML